MIASIEYTVINGHQKKQGKDILQVNIPWKVCNGLEMQWIVEHYLALQLKTSAEA